MDLVVPVAGVERFAWLGAASCNGTWSRLSNVTGRHVKGTDFKIDYLFCPTDIGGPLINACTVRFTSY